MKKNLNCQLVLLPSALVLVYAMLLSFRIGYAKVEDNECNPKIPSSGNWILIQQGQSNCLFSGGPAPDSLWPSENTRYNTAHTISGNYKIVVQLEGIGKIVPPASGNGECVIGFTAARAVAECAHWETITSSRQDGWSYQWSVSNNVCTETATWEMTGEKVVSYFSFYERYYSTYEWVCDESCNDCNLGLSCPVDM